MFSPALWVVLFPFGIALADEQPADPTDPVPPSTSEPESGDPETDIRAEVDAFLADTPTPTSSDTPIAPPPNAFNPSITAFGDVLYSASLHKGTLNPTSTPWVRSLELDVRSDVDPFAKAVAVIAIEQHDPIVLEETHHDHAHHEEAESEDTDTHEEHSGFSVVPEEVYIDLVALPAHFSARIGQQLLPFGVTNRMHPHDWPWPQMPLPFATLIGDHGVSDVGAVLNYRVHNPWDKALTLQGGLVSGAFFDTDLSDPSPGWLGRAELFDELGAIELGLGVSAMGLGSQRLEGADLLLRWRGNSWRSVVLIGELIREGAQGDSAAGDLGWVGTLQFQPTRPLYLGVRVDGLGKDTGYGGTLSYYTSEFLRLRLATFTDGDHMRIDGQLTFVWGSHPVEPYWVNR